MVAWCMAHGAWCMAHGAWRMVHGAWCMVHGAWVHGRSADVGYTCLCRVTAGEAFELLANATADSRRAIAHARQLAAGAAVAADLAATTGAELEAAEQRLARARMLDSDDSCCECEGQLPSCAVAGGGKRGAISKAEAQAKQQRAEVNRQRWSEWSSTVATAPAATTVAAPPAAAAHAAATFSAAVSPAVCSAEPTTTAPAVEPAVEPASDNAPPASIPTAPVPAVEAAASAVAAARRLHEHAEMEAASASAEATTAAEIAAELLALAAKAEAAVAGIGGVDPPPRVACHKAQNLSISGASGCSA